MNRLIICTILLLSSQAVLAEKLYRWIEPDGSITFSPNPPPAGVDYKAVNSAAIGSSGLTQPSILATSEHDLNRPAPRVDNSVAEAPATPAAAKQGLSYAPEIGTRRNRATNTTVAELATPAQAQRSSTAVASSKKRRQCQDLSKRVLSLERRLRSPLTPVDMDNTVIAMARYQKSYDRHCIE